MRFNVRCIWIFVCLWLPGSVWIERSFAQGSGYEHERASITLGVFVTDLETDTRLDSTFGLGTEIRLEDDLGLESTTQVIRLGASVWIKPRQRFDFSIFDLSRSATRTIDETIVFGDQAFVIDTTLTTLAELAITKGDYTFAVLDRRKGYLGITGGLYIGQTKLVLSEPKLGSIESGDLTAPLPVIGLRGEYAVGDRITIRGSTEWFRIDINRASGRLNDLYLSADFRLGERFGVGLAYNEVTMGLLAEDEGDWVGRLDWSYDGWLAYFKADFGR